MIEVNMDQEEVNVSSAPSVSSRESSPVNSAQPPLAMQTSSQFIEDGLDIEHGGGGENSTDETDPSPKRIKLSLESGDESSQSMTVENGIFDTKQRQYYSSCKLDMSQSNLEFDILDEFESNDADEHEVSDDSCSSSDGEISDEEIYAMLEEGLKAPKPPSKTGTVECEEEIPYEVKEKIVLKVRRRDHFDVLPEGWIEVTHNSGMPVYLHKQTRVCCMSRPYFLGPGSARKHEIPISAIPCLHYAKEVDREKEEQLNKESTRCPVNGESSAAKIVPSARVECVEESKREGSLDYLAVREYCKKRFEFQTVAVKRFKTWVGRRKHQKMAKQAQQRPTLPENTKLITCPLPTPDDKGQGLGSNVKREFIMNPSGKSAVCILHEYVQHTLRVQPRYVFRELENASTPYGATVMINNMEYGSGFGSSKKQAKSEAAKAALQILIPKMQLFGDENQRDKEKDYQDVEFFDQVRVEDPRVCELCIKAGQPYPYQILLECLKRNYGMGNTDISFGMRNLKHQKNEFTITVGKHTASVICKNKRDGKQRASQAILQMLHPQITSWGSLLRMYGIGSRQTLKEKKEEEQRITELQSKACANKPNMSILNKLKEEMLKYRKVRESMKPIGKLIPEKQELLSTSDSNLKNVEL